MIHGLVDPQMLEPMYSTLLSEAVNMANTDVVEAQEDLIASADP